MTGSPEAQRVVYAHWTARVVRLHEILNAPITSLGELHRLQTGDVIFPRFIRSLITFTSLPSIFLIFNSTECSRGPASDAIQFSKPDIYPSVSILLFAIHVRILCIKIHRYSTLITNTILRNSANTHCNKLNIRSITFPLQPSLSTTLLSANILNPHRDITLGCRSLYFNTNCRKISSNMSKK